MAQNTHNTNGLSLFVSPEPERRPFASDKSTPLRDARKEIAALKVALDKANQDNIKGNQAYKDLVKKNEALKVQALKDKKAYSEVEMEIARCRDQHRVTKLKLEVSEAEVMRCHEHITQFAAREEAEEMRLEEMAAQKSGHVNGDADVDCEDVNGMEM